MPEPLHCSGSSKPVILVIWLKLSQYRGCVHFIGPEMPWVWFAVLPVKEVLHPPKSTACFCGSLPAVSLTKRCV